MTGLTVFVVEDDADLRNSMAELLSSVGMSVITYGEAREFLNGFDAEKAGCVVADVRLPDMSGLDLLQELNQRGSSVPFIAITGYADVPMAVESMKAGASDFIEKPFRPQYLLDQIQQCMAKSEESRRLRSEQRERSARLKRLTPREREVVEFVADGKTSRAIAEMLGLSPRTVHAHRAVAKSKLGATSLADLVHIVQQARGEAMDRADAVENGLTGGNGHPT
jgi:FixJ family two-component response regulator